MSKLVLLDQAQDILQQLVCFSFQKSAFVALFGASFGFTPPRGWKDGEHEDVVREGDQPGAAQSPEDGVFGKVLELDVNF